MTLTNRTLATLLVATLSCIATWQVAQAQSAIAYNPTARILADMARKGYSETIEDMHVKVLGGYVRVNRTLVGSDWEFNQNWFPAIATSGCGGRKVMRGQYRYDYTGTETVSYQGTDHEADTFAFFTDRRIIAVQDPNNPPPEAIASASGSSGGSSGGPAIGCVEVPAQYLSLRWEDSFGNWIEYDGQNGRILRYGNRNDVQVSFEYDANGNMEGVNDHFGTRILTYQYQANRVALITDYTNRQVQYIWAPDGSTLDKVIDVRGKEWLYTYDGNRRLTKVVDPEGREKIITIGATGGVESVIMAEAGETDGVGTHYSYAYDPTAVEFTAISRKTGGREESITYDEDGFIIRRDRNGTTLYTREILNGGRKRVRTEHNGNTTTSEYDERNNRIRITFANGDVIATTYNEYSQPLRKVDEVGTLTLYEYDANGNLEQMTEAAGTPVERVSEYGYNQYGQMEEMRSLGDDNTLPTTSTFTYDNYGNLRTETDPSGELSEWTYDVMGNELVHTDRRGKLWRRVYDEAGNVLLLTDPLDNAVSYDYDDVGNIIRFTDAEFFETEFEYDSRDNLTAIIDALAGRTEVIYDDNDRVALIKDAEGKVREKRNEANGRPVLLSDGAGNEIAFGYANKSVSANGFYEQLNSISYPTYIRSLEYDRRGRPARAIDSLGNGEILESRFGFDAADRLVSLTDPRGSTTRSPRDAIGRIAAVIDALDDETRLRYDDRDNLIEVIDPRGKLLKFEYDLNDRATAEVKPLGQRASYGYDQEGNMVRIDDANGQRLEYGYDDAGRLVSIDHYRDAANATPDRSHVFGYNARNLLETWDDGETSGSRDYDELGRLKSETVNFGNFSLTYSLTYNANSTVNTFTDADGTVYRYIYDGDNKPNGVVIPGVGTIAVNEFEWLAPKKLTLPGGTTEEYQYTPFLELSAITVSDSAGSMLASRVMSFDAARNVLTKNTEQGDNTYSYDAANRLTDAARSSAGDNVYTYDGMGNRLTLDGGSTIWQYDDNNRLLSAGAVAYSYDNNGSVVSRTENGQTRNFFYDVANRLERVEDGAGTIIAEYGYDGADRRVWKEVEGVRTYFLYSQSGLIGEYDEVGAVKKTYGYLHGNKWGTDPIFLRTANGYNFYHNDHLGTPYMLSNRNSGITWKAEAGPFGATTVFIDEVENNLRFAGQYYDQETGLHYNYHRIYDPATGRYLQSDPIGIGDGPNTYGYAHQNPLSYNDPTGEFGLPGAIAGALFNFGVQFFSNMYLSGGDFWRSLKCINLVDVAISGAMGAIGPTFGKNIWQGVPGPGGLTRGQNAYIYATRAVPVGFVAKTAAPDLTPSDMLKSEDCDPDECGGLEMTGVWSKFAQ